MCVCNLHMFELINFSALKQKLIYFVWNIFSETSCFEAELSFYTRYGVLPKNVKAHISWQKYTQVKGSIALNEVPQTKC